MMEEEKELIKSLNDQLQLELPDQLKFDDLRQSLAQSIHELINTDFEKLVNLLYRIDVSEEKLRNLLEESDQDAGTIIADLIIERQIEKIRSRRSFEQDSEIDEDERW